MLNNSSQPMQECPSEAVHSAGVLGVLGGAQVLPKETPTSVCKGLVATLVCRTSSDQVHLVMALRGEDDH